MSYLLKVATIDIILSLHRRGWSQRRIACELNVNRETVARHLKHAKSAAEPANAPTGSDIPDPAAEPANAPIGADTPDPVSKPANVPTGVDDPETRPIASHGSPPITVASRKSECEPWRKVIQSKCDLGLSRHSASTRISLPNTTSRAATTASAVLSVAWSRRASFRFAALSADPAKKPKSTLVQAPDYRPRWQTPQNSCFPHRPVPLPQGL